MSLSTEQKPQFLRNAATDKPAKRPKDLFNKLYEDGLKKQKNYILFE